MFEIGQKVVALSNGLVGEVVYVEDNLVYIETDGGAEHEFMADDLKIWSPEPVPVPVFDEKSTMSLADVPYIPQKGDRQLAVRVMNMVKSIFPMVLDGVRVGCEGYDDLDAFDQVKGLSETTGTPMVVFMGAAEMNDDGLMREILQRTLLINVISDSGLVCDMLLGKAKRVIKEYEEGV